MDVNNTISNIKSIEIARILIQNYSYQEVMIKNVSGIFLENKSAKYPLIRISNLVFNDIAEFNQDVEQVNRLIYEYKLITRLDNAKCLCIYFDGFVQKQVNDAISIVLKNNEDVINNDIINNDFSLLVNRLNLNKYDNTNVFMNNEINNTINNRTLIKNFDATMLIKNNRFTNLFIIIFLAANLFFNFNETNTNVYYYDFSLYSVFVEQLHQYYRILTGLFINQGILTVFIITYCLYFYGKYIELKIGTKKTLVFYILGIIAIIFSMLFVEKGNLFMGSFPLVALVTGGYFGVILLPSERSFLKVMLANSTTAILMLVLIFLAAETTMITSLIALLVGFTLAYALQIKDVAINKTMFASNIIIILLMLSSRFLPYQDIARDNLFEKTYLSYKALIDKDDANKQQETIKHYYEQIGAVYLDE